MGRLGLAQDNPVVPFGKEHTRRGTRQSVVDSGGLGEEQPGLKMLFWLLLEQVLGTEAWFVGGASVLLYI
jgi:hypothetical protein